MKFVGCYPANGMPIQRAREFVRDPSDLFKVTGDSRETWRGHGVEKFLCSDKFVSIGRRFSCDDYGKRPAEPMRARGDVGFCVTPETENASAFARPTRPLPMAVAAARAADFEEVAIPDAAAVTAPVPCDLLRGRAKGLRQRPLTEFQERLPGGDSHPRLRKADHLRCRIVIPIVRSVRHRRSQLALSRP